MKTQLENVPLPIVMKFEGKYQAYENGKKRDDVILEADYDGKELEVSVDDKIKNKTAYLQLTNEELFDLMTRKHREQGLIKQLEDELNGDKPDNRKKRVKGPKKTQRTSNIQRKIKRDKKKQTRRKK